MGPFTPHAPQERKLSRDFFFEQEMAQSMAKKYGKKSGFYQRILSLLKKRNGPKFTNTAPSVIKSAGPKL